VLWRWLMTLPIYTYMYIYIYINKLHGLSPQANYTDRATSPCQRS
jgi:hypothetical protein